MKITVEIGEVKQGEAPCAVEVYFDQEGLETFIHRLQLIKDGKTDHVHLFTPSWGAEDEDLSEEKVIEKNNLGHHLKLTLI